MLRNPRSSLVLHLQTSEVNVLTVKRQYQNVNQANFCTLSAMNSKNTKKWVHGSYPKGDKFLELYQLPCSSFKDWHVKMIEIRRNDSDIDIS